jgi:tRNA modification GTPase
VYNTKDNIVALATIPGKSALNIVRCSGGASAALYQALFNKLRIPKPNFVHLKSAYFNNQIIDECMVTFFNGPRSYTGEDMLEISTHGGEIIAKKLISIIEKKGFRQAFPGEFTYRAFISGKIDLVQAESIQSAIDSGNNLDTLYSIGNIKGSFSKKIVSTTSKIKNILTYMEHELDFNEDEINFKAKTKYLNNIRQTAESIKKIINFSYLSSENKSSVIIVLAGKTNVGKSSIFNCLLGYNRSIVTNERGTTRDTVEAEIIINQINVRIIDTAGIRKTKAIIEKKGISRTVSAIEKADLVLFVDDVSPQKYMKNFTSLLENKKTIFINSKSDLQKHKKEIGSICVSAKKERGINSLFKKITTEIELYLKNFVDTNLFLINERQKNILKETVEILDKTAHIYKTTNDLTIAASCLRGAFNKLGEMQGYNNKNEIINKIFKGFCVGK